MSNGSVVLHHERISVMCVCGIGVMCLIFGRRSALVGHHRLIPNSHGPTRRDETVFVWIRCQRNLSASHLLIFSVHVGAARVVCRAGSMQLSGVCLSVRLSVRPIRSLHAAAAGLLLWVRRPGARFTKYLTTILRLSYDNAKVTIDLRWTSKVQNILRRRQGFS